jgi:hypothetical protein
MKRAEGWFKVYGYMVLVEDGIVICGYSLGSAPYTLYPYKATAAGWELADMSLTTFRARVKRGEACMK